MDLEKYRNDIEAYKLSVMVNSRLGVPREELMIKTIEKSLELYEEEPKKEFLLGALLVIQAYLELGFSYRRNEELFEEVLKKFGKNRVQVFPRPFYAATKVKLNRSQVRSMLRKWSGNQKNTMAITQVVEDILAKVTGREQGVYYYTNYLAGTDPDIYELVIQEEECYFHDVKCDRFYVFPEIAQA